MLIHRLIFVGFVLCAGCADIPAPIKTTPVSNVQLAEVRASAQQFEGAKIRWGGQIAAVHNLKEHTQLDIVARRLNNDGRPYAEDKSEGRFLAILSGFVDPTLYEKGREVTVVGSVIGTQQQLIGEYAYQYPLVRVEHVHLWPPRPPPAPYYDDPWWDPWYPWPGSPHRW